jgi:hypothetical protein
VTGASVLNPSGEILAFNGNYLVEGLSTSRNVLRSAYFDIKPGATAGTNLDILNQAGATYGFNTPAVTNADDLAANGTSGSWALDAAGAILTLTLTETIVGIVGISTEIHKVNSASTSEMYFPQIQLSGGTIQLRCKKRGATANTSWLTVMDASDQMTILIAFVTAT